ILAPQPREAWWRERFQVSFWNAWNALWMNDVKIMVGLYTINVSMCKKFTICKEEGRLGTIARRVSDVAIHAAVQVF
ncbi:MAG: hypothetical protein LBR88_04685, partial [Zoogloeaceae bacterium]|nr:hypothetical protein [Zoogloeaceae bacterium]